MTVETWDIRTLSAEQAAAIGELIAKVWPKPNVTAADRAAQIRDHGRRSVAPGEPEPRCFVVREDDRVVAHAAILPRTIGTTRGELTIAGLLRVGADPELRGRGLGELVVRTALAPVDAGEFPFAVFQASRRVQAFYEKLGAVVVDNRIFNSLADEPTANPFWDDVAMRYPGGREWPDGPIDLRGPGF